MFGYTSHGMMGRWTPSYSLANPLWGLGRLVVPLDWRAWVVMLPVVAASSLAGVYMTRWILKLVPLWEA